MQEILRDCILYQAMICGVVVGAVALKMVKDSVWVEAVYIAGRAFEDLAEFVESKAAEKSMLCGRSVRVLFRTERRGLVVKAEKIGYRVKYQSGAGVVMEKEIQCFM